jgi:hypothetical protein
LKIVINISRMVVVIGGALFFGAALTDCSKPLPPVRGTGLVFSEEGIHLAVVGQSCSHDGLPEGAKKGFVDATVAIEVGNPTSSPVAVYRDRFVLVPSNGSTVRTYTPAAAEGMSVETGVTVAFTLSFMVRRASCSQQMRLEPDSALEFRGRPINIGAVQFVSAASP